MPSRAGIPACSFAAAIYRLRRYLAPPQFAINFYCANAPYFRPKSAGISPHSSVSHLRTSVL